MNNNVTMSAKDTISAALAECFVTIGTRRYNFMQAINLEATFEKTKTEVPILGKTGKGKTFFHFIRKLTRNFNEKGILWGNLYAFDFKKGDPKKNNEGISILELEMLSAELLKAQIEILKPRIIIFATGNGGVDSRKRMFNLDFSGKDEFYDKSGNLLPKKYVEFFKFSEQAEHNEIYSTIDGYRIRHPSSRYKKDSYARDSLVKHLLNKNC